MRIIRNQTVDFLDGISCCNGTIQIMPNRIRQGILILNLVNPPGMRFKSKSEQPVNYHGKYGFILD